MSTPNRAVAPSSAVAKVLAKLGALKKSTTGWMARCPAHDDRVASLAISEGSDGKALLHCHAGCTYDAIVATLNLRTADLFQTPTPAPIAAAIPKGADKVYDYRDADNVLRYQVVRFPPKEFRQRRPDGVGGWIWRTGKDVKRVPYRLPELRGHQTVFIVEGEKDADNLWALGFAATTNAGGAGKWGATETKAIKEAGVTRVVILPDNDKPGQKHALDIGTQCRKRDIAVTIINLPNLPPNGDVSDWLDAGHGRDDIETLLTTTPYVVPKGAPSATSPHPVVDVPPPIPQSAQYKKSDLGNAEYFRDRFGDRVRYDKQKDHWLLWHDHYWKPDINHATRRLAHEHVREWQRAVAEHVADPLVRKELLDFTGKLERSGAFDSMFKEAKTMLPICTSGDEWDGNDWLLGCPNGVIDLTTGTLRPGERGDMITLQVGAPYDPDAECPRWLKFLDEVFEGDTELIDYIQKALGYSLTGDMREQCFFLAVGVGSNGKSVFLDTLERVWGTYGMRANMRVFVKTASEEDKFHLADFQSRRLVFAAETSPEGRMNEHILKNFTGGESLRVERKYGHPFTIRPVGKIWLGVNHRPRVGDDSFGFWRRVRIIPFDRIFSGSTQDRSLALKLRAETPGILAWVVRGCLAWQKVVADGSRLAEPNRVMLATDSYQEENDLLAEFFETRTVAETDGVVTFAALYAAYREWALQDQGMNERHLLSLKGLGNKMQRRPYLRFKVHGSVRYRGLRLVQPAKDLFTEDVSEDDSDIDRR